MLNFYLCHWIDIFTRKANKDLVIDSLKICQKNMEIEIYGFVFMSNPVHLIIHLLNLRGAGNLKKHNV
jgi:putative transposase